MMCIHQLEMSFLCAREPRIYEECNDIQGGSSETVVQRERSKAIENMIAGY